MRTSFTEIFEDEVSTQAEADQSDSRKAAGRVLNDERQICLSLRYGKGVVGDLVLRCSRDNSTQGRSSRSLQRPGHAADGGVLGRSFQPM